MKKNELDLNTDKVVNRGVEKDVVSQEDLDEEALEIEDKKIIEKCLDLLQSQFAEEDAEEEEDEETKKRINEVTEKIALENFEEAYKISKAEEERDDNVDSEEQDGNEEILREDIPAPPPGFYQEIEDCETAIKEFAILHHYAIVRRRSTQGKCVFYKCDRHVFLFFFSLLHVFFPSSFL